MPEVPADLTAEYLADVTGDEPASHPVAVEVVSPVRVQEYPARSWTTQQVVISSAPQRIASQHPARASLRISALSSGVVIAAAEHTCTASSGYPLDDGEILTLDTIGEVWASGAGTLALLAQYRDG